MHTNFLFTICNNETFTRRDVDSCTTETEGVIIDYSLVSTVGEEFILSYEDNSDSSDFTS